MDYLKAFDACHAALIVTNSDYQVVHINQYFNDNISKYMTIKKGEKLTALFNLKTKPLSGYKENITHLKEQFNVAVESSQLDKQLIFVFTLTRTTSDSSLKKALRQMDQELSNGHIDIQLKINEQDCMAKDVIDSINHGFAQLAQHFSNVVNAVNLLSECDLRIDQHNDQLSGDLGILQTRLMVTVANLSESIRQTMSSSDVMSETTKNMVSQNKNLEQQIKDQSEAVTKTSQNMEELSSSVAQAARNAEDARELSVQTSEITQQGRMAVLEVVESMNAIDKSANEITDIVEIINGIAFQTNILALNAAVEAARAGEHGRSFGIVATEVRALASRSAEAAKQIKTLIDNSRENSSRGKLLAKNAESQMIDILNGVKSTAKQIKSIATATSEQKLGIQDAENAILDIQELTRKNQNLVSQISTETEELNQQAIYLNDAAKIFYLPTSEFSHDFHQIAKNDAVEAAKKVAKKFEQLIQTGIISKNNLFNYHYTPIANTSPEKFSTPYDELCDKYLPGIQEPILDNNNSYVYAIVVDYNGYVPTHNNRFCKPLTGDPKVDLAGNRTKRIFSDRVGTLVGKHTNPYKLQTYRRDTGELIFDMSAPIYVNGEHWGGIRIGYRIS